MATSFTITVQSLATPLTNTEAPSADDGDTLFDFDARQPVDPLRFFNIGDRVRVSEGTHAGVRGYKIIAYEGIIATFARNNYCEVRPVILQRREVRIVSVDDISPSTRAADEHDAKPQKQAAVLKSELEASGRANGVLSEKLAHAKLCTSKLGTRLKTVETERDAAEATVTNSSRSSTIFKRFCSAKKIRFDPMPGECSWFIYEVGRGLIGTDDCWPRKSRAAPGECRCKRAESPCQTILQAAKRIS